MCHIFQCCLGLVIGPIEHQSYELNSWSFKSSSERPADPYPGDPDHLKRCSGGSDTSASESMWYVRYSVLQYVHTCLCWYKRTGLHHQCCDTLACFQSLLSGPVLGSSSIDWLVIWSSGVYLLKCCDVSEELLFSEAASVSCRLWSSGRPLKLHILVLLSTPLLV